MAMTATPTIPTKGLRFSRETAPVFWIGQHPLGAEERW